MKKIVLMMCIWVGGIHAAMGEIRFEDDFSEAGDLSQWVLTHPLLAGDAVVVEEGRLLLNGPDGRLSGDIWESVLESEKTFQESGSYTLSFEIRTDIRAVEARGHVRVGLPGGLEMRWWDWDNPGRLYYQGEEVGVIDNGSRTKAMRFTMTQNGREVRVFKNEDSIYQGRMTAPPDYKRYNRIWLFTKFPVATPTVVKNISLVFAEGEQAVEDEEHDDVGSVSGPYRHSWTLENSPTLHTVSMTVSGKVKADTRQVKVEVGMLDEGSWQAELDVDESGSFEGRLRAEDFTKVTAGKTGSPLVLGYVDRFSITQREHPEAMPEEIDVTWVEDRQVSYPWESDPDSESVDDEGRTFWPGLHRNNGGHFAWRYEPNGLLIDNVAFDYLDREYYAGGGFRFSFGIPGAVAPEVKQVVIDDEGLAITGLENRVDYIVDQGHYRQDEIEADWTSFQWARDIETENGETYRQQLRYSTLAIGVQVETEAPRFAFSFGPEDSPRAPVAVWMETAEGPRPVAAGGAVDIGQDMQGDWLLLFSGDARGEAPMMLVFERRPDRIVWEESRVVVERAGGVGTIAIGSPFGAPWQARNLGDRWERDVSVVPMAHIDMAANLLTAYPWKCEETFAVEGDEVWIRNRFTYLPWSSEWERDPQPRAPLPPLIAYSIQEGYLPDDTVEGMEDAGIPTKWGPLWTKPGEELLYRLSLPRAWDWFPLAVEPASAVEKKMHASLTERSFTEDAFARLLRPDIAPPKHPHYVAQDFSASAWRAMAYMSPDQRNRFKELAGNRVWHALFPQSYRLRSDPITGTLYLACTFVWNREDRVNGEGFADIDYWQGLTLYGLYTHAKYSGDWELMRRNWPTIRSLFSYWEAVNSWALMAPGAREAGEMYHADMGTAGYAGLIGYYRLAERLGTPYQRDLGAYLLAKNAVQSTAKFGFGKWVRHLSHREYVPGRSSSGFGERWVASFPGIHPDRSDFRSGDIWWLTGCVGPLSVQVEALDLWLERAPADAEQFQADLRGQISDAQLLEHDARRVIPHIMMRDYLGGEWRENAADLYDRYQQSYLLRDVHAPASYLSRDSRAWLIDWTPGVLGKSTWSREEQRALVTLTTPEATVLRWLVTSEPKQTTRNGEVYPVDIQPAGNGWNTLDIALETGDHRIELTW